MKFRFRELAVLAAALWLASPVEPVLAQVSSPVDEAAFRRVSDKLICQCGCNYGLSVCPHLECPSAPQLRAAIREQLRQGASDQQILESMVASFGPAILAAPPAKGGFNLLGWVMPFAALLLGLWLVERVVRRWRRRRPDSVVDPALLARYQASAEKEMKRLEE